MDYKLPITSKVGFDIPYIPREIITSIIKKSTFPRVAVEEKNSELWCETLSGYGKITLNDGSVITGKIQNGVLCTDTEHFAQCIINFANGTKYEGEIQKNQLTGKGTYTFPSGAHYTGDIYYGMRHGYGLYTSADGIMYEGSWKMGKKKGNGKLIKGDMTYEGNFENGLIEGKGKLIWSNGNTYEGEFKNNLINGNGSMIWLEQNVKYIGQWENNLQNGIGVNIWYGLPNTNNTENPSKGLRNRYVGQWKKGMRNGYGIFFYSDGSKYEGYWENNEKSGFGVYIEKNGIEYVGKFVHDRMIDLNTEGIVQVGKVEVEEEKNEDPKGKPKKVTPVSALPKVEKKKKPSVNRPASPLKGITKLETIMENVSENNSKKNLFSSPSRGGISPKKGRISPIKESLSQKDKIDLPSHPIHGKNPFYLASKYILKETESNPFKTMLNAFDLIETESNFEKVEKELSDILLRKSIEIRRCYYKLCKVIEPQQEVDNFFNSRQNTIYSNMDDMQVPMELNEDLNKGDLTPGAGVVKDDKIGVYLELCDLWKFFRDYGIVAADLTIAQFDKIFYKSPKNRKEMFIIPSNLPKGAVYDYIYKTLTNSMDAFNKKYLNSKEEKEKKFASYFNEDKDYLTATTFDYHSPHNCILLSQFYDALIRAAYIKYSNLDMSLYQKLDLVLSRFIVSRPAMKKSKSSSKSNLFMSGMMHDLSMQLSTVVTKEQKQRNDERIAIDNFNEKYQNLIYAIFLRMCYMQNEKNSTLFSESDMTLSHRFIYENLVMKCEMIKAYYGSKKAYAEYITHYFKEKKTNFSNARDAFAYYDDLFDLEIIFYEFCEFIYFCCEKLRSAKTLKEISDLEKARLFQMKKAKEELEKARAPPEEQVEKEKEEDEKSKKGKGKSKEKSIIRAKDKKGTTKRAESRKTTKKTVKSKSKERTKEKKSTHKSSKSKKKEEKSILSKSKFHKEEHNDANISTIQSNVPQEPPEVHLYQNLISQPPIEQTIPPEQMKPIEEYVLPLIEEINKTLNKDASFNTKTVVRYAKDNYIYPILPAHTLVEKMRNEEVAQMHAELLKRIEKTRYTKERTDMMEDSENAYNEPKDSDEDDSMYDDSDY